MRRREFIAGLGIAAAWPVMALAQQTVRVQRIAVLMGGAADDPVWRSYVAAFRDGLARLGWTEGYNLRTELRFGESDANHMRARTAELVGLAPDVIFASSAAAARAAQQETQTIPIVGVGIAATTVQNIARPEGNVTGFPILYPSIGSKWLELLKEVAPHVIRVAWLFNPQTSFISPAGGGILVSSFKTAAPAFGVKAIDMPFDNAAQLESAVDAFATEPNGGVIVNPSAATSTRDNRQSILLLAARYRLPVVHWDHAYPAEGGLMSYGSDFEHLHRQAAAYVDRILRGAQVIDLPVQYPTKFKLVVNLKAAKAIGLSISETFLVRTDEVIE
jgi:putative tryptophan/tyrosine transport system substrate-binding protein